MTVRTQLALIVAVHVGLSAFLSAKLNVWADEACTLYATEGSWGSVCQKALDFEWQPPAYYLVLNLWRRCHAGVFFARCFSIVCTSLTMLTIFRIGHLLGVKQPVLPAALFAFHPFGIYLGTEIRLYGFATLLSAVMLWTMISAYRFVPGVAPAWPNTACIGLALYTNILLTIPLAGQAASLLLLRRDLLLRFIGRMLLVLALFAPMLWMQLCLMQETELPPQENTLAHMAVYLLGSWQYIIFPLPRTNATLVGRIVLLALLGGLVGGIMHRHRRRLTERHVLLASFTAVCYLALAAFIGVTQLARTERYTYMLVPPTLLSWAMLLDLAEEARWKKLVYAISFALCAISVVIVFGSLSKSGDWIRVTRYVQSTAEPGQPILAFPSEVRTLLKYYYDDCDQIVAVPGPQRFDRFRMSDFRIADRQTLVRLLSDPLRSARSVMLVTFNPAIFRSGSGDPLNFGLLESYLSEEFTEVRRTEFLDTTVRSYQRK